MQYGLKILQERLIKELNDRVEYEQYSHSLDQQTVVWAERNLKSQVARIEGLQETITYIKIEVDRLKEEKKDRQRMETKKDIKKKQNSS